MKKLFIAVVFVLAMVTIGRAQNISITPSVQPSMGGSGQIGNAVFDYTVGEPFQTSIVNGNNMFTQGFQQPEKPLPPVAPVSQTVCSDTAVTFVFITRIAGAGANQTEWSLFHDFSYSTFNSTDSALKITVAIGQTDTIYFRSRVSGNGLVSDSVVYAIFKVNYKPQPPTPPAPVSVNSDTAYTFHFLNLNPGFGGNRLEWSLDSFATSYFMTCFDTVLNGKDTSSCTISVKVHPLSDTLIWVRSVDTVTGCLSNSKTSIAIVTHVFQRQPINVDTIISVCVGSAATLKIDSSHHTHRYDLLADTGRVAYAYGNDSVLHISTGNVYTNTFFNVLATDTATGDTVTIGGTTLVAAINTVDSDVYIEGDTLVYINDTAYYEASANNALKKRYSIVSGTATIDSLTGMVTGIGSGFIVRATLSGPASCGTVTGDRHVGVATIKIPVAPEPKTAYLDSINQTITVTFDSVLAGAGGDQIEWATNPAFTGSTIASSPATISITLNGASDSLVWLRTRSSSTLKSSKAVTTEVITDLPTLDAGLLDKSYWQLDGRSDEFNYNQDPSGITHYPNEPLIQTSGFFSKWDLTYIWGANTQADYCDADAYTLVDADIEVDVNDVGDWNNLPNCSSTTPIAHGSDYEVGLRTDDVCVLKASKLANPIHNTWKPGHPRICTYQTGMLASKARLPMVNSLWEIRCKFPPAYTGVNTAFWNFTGFGDFTIIDGGASVDGANISNSVAQGIGDGYIYPNTNECGAGVVKRTHCDYSQDWHTFSAVSSPTGIFCFVDGKETWSTTFSDVDLAHAISVPNVTDKIANRFPNDIFSGSTWLSHIYINLYVRDNSSTGKPVPVWTNTDCNFLIDYFRYYTPSNTINVANPAAQVLQNLSASGVPQTVETPNNANANISPTHTANNNNRLYINNTYDRHTSMLNSAQVVYTNEPGLQKIYYIGIDNRLYNAYLSGSNWVEYALKNGIADVRDVSSHVVVDGTRVYYFSTLGEIKFFQWVGFYWSNHGTGVHPLTSNFTIDAQGRVFYIGSGHNVHAWCPTNNTLGTDFTITTDGNAYNSLTMHSCGCLMYYEDNSGAMHQKSWWNTWRDNNTLPVNSGASLVMDETNSRLYFAHANPQNTGTDIFQYTWDYNQVNAGDLKELGSCCHDYDNAFLATPTLDPPKTIALGNNKNMVYYMGTDNRMWYYYNDKDPDPAHVNWYRTRVNYSAGFLGQPAVEPYGLGKLFYTGTDFLVHVVDWTPADNPLNCPSTPNGGALPSIAAYKADDSEANKLSQAAKTDSSGQIIMHVFPNPSKEMFTFSIVNLVDDQDVELKIYDLNGNCFKTFKQHESGSKAQNVIWNAAGVSEGIYFYKATFSSDQSLMGKLMKM